MTARISVYTQIFLITKQKENDLFLTTFAGHKEFKGTKAMVHKCRKLFQALAF
jgi:hypothetical protein